MINIAIDGPTASGYKYSIYNNTLIDDFKNFKNKNILNEINTIIKNLSEEDYFYSEQQVAELSKNVELYENLIYFYMKLQKKKALLALRRARQLKLNDITNDIWLDILNQDSKSFDLIEKVKKGSKIIDTTNLTLTNIVDLVLTQLTN
ncbi:hypothetical protein C2G38_2173901 [Gigaspora rosea]|uniref:Uncharacterized protein n=1 Tax=Gigaspora rosea TaxID=44941 RepID=A0A397VJ14_9GLOM|nr:hypothetical protein C2G38_2173901 [Gigaspora rosea]